MIQNSWRTIVRTSVVKFWWKFLRILTAKLWVQHWRMAENLQQLSLKILSNRLSYKKAKIEKKKNYKTIFCERIFYGIICFQNRTEGVTYFRFSELKRFELDYTESWIGQEHYHQVSKLLSLRCVNCQSWQWESLTIENRSGRNITWSEYDPVQSWNIYWTCPRVLFFFQLFGN